MEDKKQFYIFRGTFKKEEFIQQYEDSYYLSEKDSDDKKISQIAPNASGSRAHIERMIEVILKKGIQSKLDVVLILAWKMSKFKQSDCKPDGKLVYAEDWSNLQGIIEEGITSDLQVKRYGKPFKIGKIACTIHDNIEALEKAADISWQEALRETHALLKEFDDGLGPVYYLTLVYFISRKQYPIYDQFAAIALTAIENGIAPGKKVEYKGLSTVEDLLENDDPKYGYEQYILRLEAIFGNKYKCRSVDRSLWVYGHYFTPIKPQKEQ